MNKKRKEFKELCKRHKALEQILDEHLATHEALIRTHEKLKKAHSSLLAQRKESIFLSNTQKILFFF
jgi:hypothetical protein